MLVEEMVELVEVNSSTPQPFSVVILVTQEMQEMQVQ
jgi:hypothetical protein